MKVVAVIPAYNEAGKVGEIVRSLLPYVNETIVIDDGSKDETATVAYAAGAIVCRLIINRGQGAALRAGFIKALARGADIVVTFDADGQFDPADISKLVAPIIKNEVDIVLGSRMLGTDNMPLVKKMLLHLAIWLTNAFSGLSLTDTHNGLRALSRAALEQLHLNQDRMAHASEIIDQIAINHWRYLEVPVTLRYTEYSLRKGQKFGDYFKILADLSFKKLLR